MNEALQFALLGLGAGATYSLLGHGVVVIYRGSGTINFAHGALAMAGAFLNLELRERADLAAWPAAILAVAIVALLGALMQVLILHPLRHSSPVTRLIATLGLLTVLTSGATLYWCAYCTVHTARHGSTHGVAIEKLRDLCDFESSAQFSKAERAALQLASHAGRTPNETSQEDFEELRKFFDDDAILEIVAVISFFGFFNRWNDTLSVPLEDKPLQFGLEVLTPGGWNPGRHVG